MGKSESYLEEQFERMVRVCCLPEPRRQHEFCGFRFDFAWPSVRVAVEIDGGTYCKRGSHVWGKDYQRQCIKQNLAQEHGWVVLRADRYMTGDAEFSAQVRRIIRRRLNRGRNKIRVERHRDY